MATLKQIEANRRNALKSTGPRTPEGKAAVRLNSLQHGLRAQTLILPGENREEFDQLLAGFEAEWQPQSLTAGAYVERMAIAQWKLRRLEVAETNLLSQSQIRLERSFAHAQHELERLQGPLPKQQPAPELQAPSNVSPLPYRGPQPEPTAEWVCSAASVPAPETLSPDVCTAAGFLLTSDS